MAKQFMLTLDYFSAVFYRLNDTFPRDVQDIVPM